MNLKFGSGIRRRVLVGVPLHCKASVSGLDFFFIGERGETKNFIVCIARGFAGRDRSL
jgi:hypothetical protein